MGKTMQYQKSAVFGVNKKESIDYDEAMLSGPLKRYIAKKKRK